jgi:hypothetical protein
MSTNENRKPREFEVYGRNLNSYPSWDICESPPVTDELIRLREVLTPEVACLAWLACHQGILNDLKGRYYK